jgi:BlaI family penicillinase repressor
MRRRSTTLTEQELEIMKIVWERDSTTVRDVYETLLERRKVAYTTVMTMMKILEQKKYLKKTQADRAYVYRPAQPKGQVIGAMVRDFINRVFNGSAEPLLVHLVEEHDLSTRGDWKRSRGCGGSHERNTVMEQSGGVQPANRAADRRGGRSIPALLRLRLPAARLVYWHDAAGGVSAAAADAPVEAGHRDGHHAGGRAHDAGDAHGAGPHAEDALVAG